ncbi:MAG: LuxR C-terminal-related transcriptional regulator [Bacteroidales bacterium]|jgi:DNA-binding CsgD family transcriptional regulator|nr:LuxR C-terminal-related transcriptional regulator [Bacteroidales bacterium]
MSGIKQILIAESSELILRGLETIIRELPIATKITVDNDISVIRDKLEIIEPDLFIFNPGIFSIDMYANFSRYFSSSLKTSYIGVIYSHYDKKILSKLDETISVYDSASVITEKISKLLLPENKGEEKPDDKNLLSSREEELLKWLAQGLSVKDISGKLFISPHTVISHRKNITRKLGIRSVPGLTIYAIINNIISTKDIVIE